VANPERTETATRDGRFMAWLILNQRKRRFEFQEFPGKQYSGDFPEYNIPGLPGMQDSGDSLEYCIPANPRNSNRRFLRFRISHAMSQSKNGNPAPPFPFVQD
jgi:hypothetical protein